ncbi:MAG: hypothetical protein MZW92_78285 [Comamonadaceae bacterium]|nr:hypothetical protein [Comamonadaceae bacterium]
MFSLFQLNPAPFCLLDEVDAPLDDTQHRTLLRHGEAHVGADPVPVHQPQQDHHGDGAAADRRHHAGAGRVARGGGGHRRRRCACAKKRPPRTEDSDGHQRSSACPSSPPA